MPYTLTLHNNVQEVSLLAPFIETIAMENGLDHSLTMELNLAVEEAVVNVMEYAYPQGETGEVTIEVSVADGLLDINIIDSGAPFDPTKKTTPTQAYRLRNVPSADWASSWSGRLWTRFSTAVTTERTY